MTHNKADQQVSGESSWGASKTESPSPSSDLREEAGAKLSAADRSFVRHLIREMRGALDGGRETPTITTGPLDPDVLERVLEVAEAAERARDEALAQIAEMQADHAENFGGKVVMSQEAFDELQSALAEAEKALEPIAELAADWFEGAGGHVYAKRPFEHMQRIEAVEVDSALVWAIRQALTTIRGKGEPPPTPQGQDHER